MTKHDELIARLRRADPIARRYDGAYMAIAKPDDPILATALEDAARTLEADVDALDHIKRVCENARQSTRRIRWIIERVKSALAGDNNWQTVEIPRHDPAVEKLETMIVSVYAIAKLELGARRELYDCADAEIPDETIRREIEVLDRFVRDARHVSAVLREAEGGT